MFVLFIAVNLFYINLKPNVYQSIVEFNKNSVFSEYNSTDFYGITIPDDVKLTFVDGINSISSYPSLFLQNDDVAPIGVYYVLSKNIYILNNLDINKKKRVLTHELAHYTYNTNLSSYQKDIIKEKYNQFCKNKGEFYAEIIEGYGSFNYN